MLEENVVMMSISRTIATFTDLKQTVVHDQMRKAQALRVASWIGSERQPLLGEVVN